MLLYETRRVHGIILVYDVTKHSSFENLERWLDSIRDFVPKGLCMMLVGTKTDRQDRVVGYEEAKVPVYTPFLLAMLQVLDDGQKV